MMSPLPPTAPTSLSATTPATPSVLAPTPTFAQAFSAFRRETPVLIQGTLAATSLASIAWLGYKTNLETAWRIAQTADGASKLHIDLNDPGANLLGLLVFGFIAPAVTGLGFGLLNQAKESFKSRAA